MACAIGLDHDLGLDVERCRRVRDGLDIASRFFAPAELALLRRSEIARRDETFVRIWTLKEAYIKAVGLGLACPLDSFAFRLNPIGIRFRHDGIDSPRHWQFAQWRPTRDCVIAVAQRAAPAKTITLAQRAVRPADL